MKQRSIYINDDLWRQVKIEAASRGVTSSQVVATALAAHFASADIRRLMPLKTVEQARKDEGLE